MRMVIPQNGEFRTVRNWLICGIAGDYTRKILRVGRAIRVDTYSVVSTLNLGTEVRL